MLRRAAVVQYFTTNQGAQRNRELIEDVLRELAARVGVRSRFCGKAV